MTNDPNDKNTDEFMSADDFLERLQKEGRIKLEKPKTPGEMLEVLVNSRRFFGPNAHGIRNSKDIDTIFDKLDAFFKRFEKLDRE